MKVLAYLALGLLCAGALVYLFREPILSAVGAYLVVEDRLRPVDVIHVIAGDDYRTEYAIQLYQQGYADYLFFTGGWCKTHGYYHGEWGRQLAVSRGIPEERVGFDDSAVVSTYQEAEGLKRWIDGAERPIRSVMVVSDPHHMRRARWTFRQVLGKEITLVMAPVPFGQAPYQRRWWTDGPSRKMVKDEYIKLVYSFVRYRLSRGALKDWLASLDTE